VFNYSRSVEFLGIIRKNDAIAKRNNESYPWKTEGKSLGLHAEIHLLPSDIEKMPSHDSFKFQGSHYQFHSPLELPFEKDPQFVSVTDFFTIFLIEPEITELGDTLKNYNIDRFDGNLKLSSSRLSSISDDSVTWKTRSR
jgi:hypothetical protein